MEASGRPARVIKLDLPAVSFVRTFVLTFVRTFSVTSYVISLPWDALKTGPRPGQNKRKLFHGDPIVSKYFGTIG